LTSSPGVVYACTNLGAIAAVRVDDGQILWLRTYSRTNFSAEAAEVSYRACRPCVYQRGMLFALPADSRELLALDAATGEILWSRSALQATAQLVGVTEDRLVLASGGLHLLDPNTGDILKSDFGRQLAGQGVVAGEVILWPESRSIQRFALTTGDRLPGDIPLPEPGGANLLAFGEYLLAAGPAQLTLFRFVSSQADQSN
jgi:glucose dehydrogenase